MSVRVTSCILTRSLSLLAVRLGSRIWFSQGRGGSLSSATARFSNFSLLSPVRAFRFFQLSIELMTKYLEVLEHASDTSTLPCSSSPCSEPLNDASSSSSSPFSYPSPGIKSGRDTVVTRLDEGREETIRHSSLASSLPCTPQPSTLRRDESRVVVCAPAGRQKKFGEGRNSRQKGSRSQLGPQPQPRGSASNRDRAVTGKEAEEEKEKAELQPGSHSFGLWCLPPEFLNPSVDLTIVRASEAFEK